MDKKTITESKMKLSMKKRPMPTKRYRPTCFTHQQVSELTARAYNMNPRLACLWHLGYLTGLRLNDLLQLEWTQVDLEKGVLEITVKMPYLAERTKLPYLRKRYPLHSELLEILEQMKREDKSNYKYLFHTWRGKKIDHLTALNIKLIDSIGVKEVISNGSRICYFYTFHSLRGSYFIRKRMAGNPKETNLTETV